MLKISHFFGLSLADENIYIIHRDADPAVTFQVLENHGKLINSYKQGNIANNIYLYRKDYYCNSFCRYFSSIWLLQPTTWNCKIKSKLFLGLFVHGNKDNKIILFPSDENTSLTDEFMIDHGEFVCELLDDKWKMHIYRYENEFYVNLFCDESKHESLVKYRKLN